MSNTVNKRIEELEDKLNALRAAIKTVSNAAETTFESIDEGMSEFLGSVDEEFESIEDSISSIISWAECHEGILIEVLKRERKLKKKIKQNEKIIEALEALNTKRFKAVEDEIKQLGGGSQLHLF